MSKDNYPSIFSPQMETIVFIILQIFFTTGAVLKIGEYYRKIHYLTREFRVNAPINVKPEGGGGRVRATHANLNVMHIPRVGILT